MRFGKGRWMVGRIFSAAKLFEAGRARRLKNRGKEFLGRDVSGTRRGDQNAVAIKPGQRGLGEFAISAQGAWFLGCAFGKTGRVQNDEAETTIGFAAHEFERVGLNGFMAD